MQIAKVILRRTCATRVQARVGIPVKWPLAKSQDHGHENGTPIRHRANHGRSALRAARIPIRTPAAAATDRGLRAPERAGGPLAFP